MIIMIIFYEGTQLANIAFSGAPNTFISENGMYTVCTHVGAKGKNWEAFLIRRDL